LCKLRKAHVAGFVGHIIGLGDRHGSNILIGQLTWAALHIDFGDVGGSSPVKIFQQSDLIAVWDRARPIVPTRKSALQTYQDDDQLLRICR
jgi:hypothetical protein